MIIKKALFITINLLCLITLVSCGPVNVPNMANYTIACNKSVMSPIAARTSNTLLVSIANANSGYETSKMIYVLVPYQLRSYAYNQWVAPPAQLLQALFAQKLTATGYFKAVVAAPFIGNTRFRLDTQLLVLEQEFYHPISQVHLGVQASVVNVATNQVVASHHFEAFVDAPGNSPYAGVLAANTAANEVSNDIATFVVHSIR